MTAIAPSSTESPAPPEVDRRADARYPSDREGSCHPAAGRDVTPVRVKDVSARGVALLSPRRFERGTVLVLEVSEVTPHPVTVLARVVRLARQGDGAWLLGCALFARLSVEDFETLRARPDATPEPRPAAVRPAVGGVASCRRLSPGALGRWKAEVTEESAARLGLISQGEVKEGARLSVELPGRDGVPPRTLVVRVVRSEARPDGRWLLGCEVCPPPS
jgi:hypothetical protein